jgi:hypothetical protein
MSSTPSPTEKYTVTVTRDGHFVLNPYDGNPYKAWAEKIYIKSPIDAYHDTEPWICYHLPTLDTFYRKAPLTMLEQKLDVWNTVEGVNMVNGKRIRNAEKLIAWVKENPVANLKKLGCRPMTVEEFVECLYREEEEDRDDDDEY